MVLQGASDDFRSAGGATVNKYHHWVIGKSAPLMGKLALNTFSVPAHGGNDQSAFDEHIGDSGRLIEETARIVAQIQDDTLNSLHVFRDQCLQLLSRVFLKAGDQLNDLASEGLIRVANVQDMMLKLGPGYKPKIDQYNYIDLSQYTY